MAVKPTLSALDVMRDAPVIPVIVLHDVAHAVPLAQALVARAPHPLRVLCPDVAGRGHSDFLADPQHYQVPLYTAAMLAMLAQLQLTQLRHEHTTDGDDQQRHTCCQDTKRIEGQ